jgi:hypothetical protein
MESTFVISDIAKALSSVDLLQTYIQSPMLAIAEAIELDLLSLGPLATFNAAVGASNTAPTEATIDAIESGFFKAKVPSGEPRICAVSADFYSSLRSLPRFTEVQTVGSGDAIVTGEFTRVKNVNFFRSQLINCRVHHDQQHRVHSERHCSRGPQAASASSRHRHHGRLCRVQEPGAPRSDELQP